MIVIFEGPRAAGKSTILGLVKDKLDENGFKSKQWKAQRGKNPISDMHTSIDMGEFKDEKTIFLIDRFHLSELVLSRILNRGWETEDDWKKIEYQLRSIDGKLAIRNTFVVMVSARDNTLKARLEAAKRDDPAFAANGQWIEAFHWTLCTTINISNDTLRVKDSLRKYTIKPIISIIEDTYLDSCIGRITKRLEKIG